MASTCSGWSGASSSKFAPSVSVSIHSVENFKPPSFSLGFDEHEEEGDEEREVEAIANISAEVVPGSSLRRAFDGEPSCREEEEPISKKPRIHPDVPVACESPIPDVATPVQILRDQTSCKDSIYECTGTNGSLEKFSFSLLGSDLSPIDLTVSPLEKLMSRNAPVKPFLSTSKFWGRAIKKHKFGPLSVNDVIDLDELGFKRKDRKGEEEEEESPLKCGGNLLKRLKRGPALNSKKSLSAAFQSPPDNAVSGILLERKQATSNTHQAKQAYCSASDVNCTASDAFVLPIIHIEADDIEDFSSQDDQFSPGSPLRKGSKGLPASVKAKGSSSARIDKGPVIILERKNLETQFSRQVISTPNLSHETRPRSRDNYDPCRVDCLDSEFAINPEPKLKRPVKQALLTARAGQQNSHSIQNSVVRDILSDATCSLNDASPSGCVDSKGYKLCDTLDHTISQFLQDRLRHFKSVSALVLDGGLDLEPVYIDYRNQFQGAKLSSRTQFTVAGFDTSANISGSSNASTGWLQAGRRKVATGSSVVKKVTKSKGTMQRKQVREGDGKGRWITIRGGGRVYVTGAGKKLKGRSAYKAHLKDGASRSSKSGKKKGVKKHRTS